MVCGHCFETRHPQTLIRPPEDDPSVPWSRPEGTDVYITPGEIILTESSLYMSAEDGSFLLTET
jgi:hypothetical protein